eukprot:8879721-Pyramimonas_sp.AAC.1
MDSIEFHRNSIGGIPSDSIGFHRLSIAVGRDNSSHAGALATEKSPPENSLPLLEKVSHQLADRLGLWKTAAAGGRLGSS